MRQQRPGQNPAPRREPCSLCVSYGFPLRARTHSLKECFALQSLQKKERGLLARQINSTIDGTELREAGQAVNITDQGHEGDIPWIDGDSSD